MAQPDERAVVRVARIRQVEGRRWHAREKSWTVPYTRRALTQLEALFGAAPAATYHGATEAAAPRAVACRRTRTRELTPAERRLIAPVEEELKLRGYSPRTRKVYRNHLLRFYRYAGRAPLALTALEVRTYLIHLVDDKRVSASYHTQAVSAIKFLYQMVLKAPRKIEDVPRPKRDRKLPSVLSRPEVLRILATMGSPKHRALLMVAYSAGLRVGEVVRLRLEDIDSDRQQIHVRRAKGRKDRYAPLSQVLMETLRTYWQADHPETWLFPGARPGCHLSVRSVQHVIEQARERAGVLKHVTMHTLIASQPTSWRTAPTSATSRSSWATPSPKLP